MLIAAYNAYSFDLTCWINPSSRNSANELDNFATSINSHKKNSHPAPVFIEHTSAWSNAASGICRCRIESKSLIPYIGCLDNVMTTATQTTFEHYSIRVRPFLKWAGGKSQLLPHLLELAPKQFNRYIEPFVGGGALFFALGKSNSVLADSNEELVITYTTVRDDVKNLIDRLRGFVNDKETFYKIRALDTSKLSNIERAARLIYLNKTCFNGLYRVNQKGEFNTPYNGAIGSNFLQPDVLQKASLALQGTTIVGGDYKDVLRDHAAKNDFIFLDPPYLPVGKYSDFKRYTKERFYIKDQEELANEFARLVALGCKVILTNSAHEAIMELFKNYDRKIVNSKRLISSDAKTRVGEDLIVLGGF